MRRESGILAVCAALAALALPAVAGAQVQPYGTNDYGGFRNILPPGQSHNATLAQVISNQATGALPPDWGNQRDKYGDLVYRAPALQASQLGDFFKDGGFGVLPGDVASGSPYSPRPGVTIVRDAGYGVPHIYGDTRPDVMFGAGYAGAQDRLFFMDTLRHSGRAELSEFAGGSNKAMDADVWNNAPYTEADLQRQFDQADDLYPDGAQLQQDVTDYVAGINAYIAQVQLNPALLPGEYTLLGKTLEPWKVTDVIATASLVGGIFGKGGGGELNNAEVYTAAKARFGKVKGIKVWRDFRRQNDPEAPTTVHAKRFPYQLRKPKRINRKSVAIPDRGSLIEGSPDDASARMASASAAEARAAGSERAGEIPSNGILGNLRAQDGGSNALLVSRRESRSGRPLAVFGPQVGYYSPQILMEQELHGGGIDASGTAFVGINLYVLLGRGQDYAWSATSAGQDIIDTFAERLCEPGGGAPTVQSMHYLWRGQCRPIEVLNRVNDITPNVADPSPAETYELEAQRTVHGIVAKRGTVNGVPVAFTRQRSTYFHEADSARGFSAFNTPAQMRNASDFKRAAQKIGFTFNWFYTDDRDIAYYNSGDNPVRAKGTDPEFPTWGTGKWDWRGWNPDLNTAAYTSARRHPQTVNQSYITSWNNKQAPAFSAAEDTYSFGSVHRVDSLDDRVERAIAGRKRMSLVGLVNAMEDAGTVDLRGSQALPWMLKVLRRGGVPGDLRDEVAALSAWAGAGAHRRDGNRDGFYDQRRAVELMDAWWPLALEGIFKPRLGDELFGKLRQAMAYDDPPSGGGSAYISGWYGYVDKDLRALLGAKLKGSYSRSYCGRGRGERKQLKTCRNVLASTLRAAAVVPASTLYPRGDNCATGDAQVCNDAVRFSTTGGVRVGEIHWINRPTWQQVVEVLGHRARGADVATKRCKRKGGCKKKSAKGKKRGKKGK
ncbi:MAG: penicillin acylase family protein [Solirubrobacterales bacterium]